MTACREPSVANAPRMTPIHPKDRVLALDALRGLAILGILIENTAAFAGYWYSLEGGATRSLSSLLRTAAAAGVLFVLEAKSYSVLALLFGWGAVFTSTPT